MNGYPVALTAKGINEAAITKYWDNQRYSRGYMGEPKG